MAVYIIAAAAAIGSFIGAFFRVRLMALLWVMPIVCVVYGASLFAAPRVRANEDAPHLLRSVMLQLADISLLVPALVAAAAGALLASSLTRYVRDSQMKGDANRAMGRLRARPVSDDERLKERADSVARRRVVEPAAMQPLPIFEIDYTPLMPAPAPTPTPAVSGSAAPPSPRAPVVEPVTNRRREGRRRSALAGELVFDDGSRVRCTIQDLSVGGARIRLGGPWPQARLTNLFDLTNGLAHEALLRWRAGPIAGLRFTGSHDLRTYKGAPVP